MPRMVSCGIGDLRVFQRAGHQSEQRNINHPSSMFIYNIQPTLCSLTPMIAAIGAVTRVKKWKANRYVVKMARDIPLFARDAPLICMFLLFIAHGEQKVPEEQAEIIAQVRYTVTHSLFVLLSEWEDKSPRGQCSERQRGEFRDVRNIYQSKLVAYRGQRNVDKCSVFAYHAMAKKHDFSKRKVRVSMLLWQWGGSRGCRRSSISLNSSSFFPAYSLFTILTCPSAASHLPPKDTRQRQLAAGDNLSRHEISGTIVSTRGWGGRSKRIGISYLQAQTASVATVCLEISISEHLRFQGKYHHNRTIFDPPHRRWYLLYRVISA